MKNLLRLFQRAIIIGIVFIVSQSQLFAQSEPISAFLGVSKKSFINTCLEQKWKFTVNESGNMNFDYPGGNWFVTFDENDVINLINLTSFGKEKGDIMMKKLTSDADLVDDNATLTRWRQGNRYLMYFKMFQPSNGSSILISDGFFNITSAVVYSSGL